MPTIPQRIYKLRGELKTNIVRTKADTSSGRLLCRVFFQNKDGVKDYTYAPDDVIELPYRGTDEGHFRFIDQKGRLSFAVRVHYFGNGDAICAETQRGYLSYGFKKGLQLETSLLDSPYRGVFDYLNALSEISTFKDNAGNIFSLKAYYDRVDAVFSGALLYDYCKPDAFNPDKRTPPKPLIFPFGCNESQYQAVSNALSNRLSIIKGPPGTGKTQTILNIVANLVIQGKSCLIVSNNNSAVENVIEKLSRPEYGMRWLVATLGKKDNKTSFFDGQTGSYPDLSSWKVPEGAQLEKLRRRLGENSAKVPAFFDAQQRLAVLQSRLDGMEFQKGLYDETAPPETPKKILGLVGLTSSKLYALLLRMEDSLAGKGRLSLSVRMKVALYGFDWRDPDRQAMEDHARRLELSEMRSEVRHFSREIKAFRPSYDALVSESLLYLRAMLRKRYGKKGQRRVFTREEVYSNVAQDFIREYPIVTSATFSATTCIDRSIPFDYLIMDEASQADIAAGALALNTATSAVIVGDPEQLPNVVNRQDAAVADGLFKRGGFPAAYDYARNTFLDSVLALFPDAPVVLLREHYRCAPEIIGYCNEQFYGGDLVVMTKKDSDEPCPISVIRSVKGNHARGHINDREAEEVVESVREIGARYKDIGVIAPFDAQVNLIKTRLVEAGYPDIPVATVHKFQGRENEAIVLSTTTNQATSFVDDSHLLNVAVSRAKKRFILVTTGNDIADGNIKALVDYIGYCGGSVRESGIRSVFDLLYAQYAEERAAFVASHTAVSQYATENFMFELLKKITAEPKYHRLGIMFQYPLKLLVSNEELLTEEEKLYSSRSWTLVDFLLFNKVTKDPVLVIEVDGMSFHKEGSEQWERDRKKDSILEKSGVPLLRLLTTMSREEERIKQALDSP